MKKTVLAIMFALMAVQIYAGEKQIYGKLEYMGTCWNIFYGEEDNYVEYPIAQLTIYYGELPQEDVLTINPDDGLPQWKGISQVSLTVDEEMVNARLALLRFDESMEEARPTSTAHWFEDMEYLAFVYHPEYLNTSQVTDMSRMFAGCKSLRCIDISNFLFGSTTAKDMFSGCANLQFVDAPSSFQQIDNETLFMGVGSREKPCVIAAPDGYDFDTSVYEPYFIYRSGYFTMAQEGPYYINLVFPNDWHNKYIIMYDKRRIFHEINCNFRVKIDPVKYVYYNFFYETNCTYESYVSGFSENTPIWRGGSGYNWRQYIIDPSFANYKPKSTKEWFKNLAFVHAAVPDSTGMRAVEITGLQYINTSETTDMSNMFENSYFEYYKFSNLNTSKVTNMSNMFSGFRGDTLDLSGFDTHNVTNMYRMFANCKAKYIDVSNFDTSNVTDMSQMFLQCAFLSSIDVSHFDTSNVTNMNEMFRIYYSWEGEPSSWGKLEHIDVSHFNTSKVQSMSRMFCGCQFLKSLDLSSFNTSEVHTMESMFALCSALENLDLHNFDFSNVTDMQNMFSRCSALENLDLGNSLSPKLTNMRTMFKECYSLTDINIGNLTTSKVTNMEAMFNDCKALKNIHWGNFSTESSQNMKKMFMGCSALETLDLSHFATQKVGSMESMFDGCTALNNLDVSSFSTTNVKNMAYMFQDCKSIEKLDLRHFDTTFCENFHSMFKGCTSLDDLDVSNFNVVQEAQTMEMMMGCSSLQKLHVSAQMENIEPDACIGVGVGEAPCKIAAPLDFNFGCSTDGDFFRWKGGRFVLFDTDNIPASITDANHHKTIYTLQGVPVSHTSRGVYIVDGKKTVVK